MLGDFKERKAQPLHRVAIKVALEIYDRIISNVRMPKSIAKTEVLSCKRRVHYKFPFGLFKLVRLNAQACFHFAQSQCRAEKVPPRCCDSIRNRRPRDIEGCYANNNCKT